LHKHLTVSEDLGDLANTGAGLAVEGGGAEISVRYPKSFETCPIALHRHLLMGKKRYTYGSNYLMVRGHNYLGLQGFLEGSHYALVEGDTSLE
jgi:hypothetical protein